MTAPVMQQSRIGGAGSPSSEKPRLANNMRLKRHVAARKRHPTSPGFTLIELLVVLAIIAILAGIMIPRYANRTEQARAAGARVDVTSSLPSALDMFELDNGFYPTTAQGLRALLEAPTTAPAANRWNGPYLKNARLKDPWGHEYVYRCPSSQPGRDYDLFSCGHDGVEAGGDDIDSAGE